MYETRTAVVVRNTDLFSEPADMLVLPCSRSGTISSNIEEKIAQFGIPGPYRGPQRAAILGQIEVYDAEPGNPVARYVCWAVTVFRTYTTLGALRTVAREAALVAESKSDIQVIATPLLGTGAGGADPMKSAAALVEGFLSAGVQSLTLRLHVWDASLAADIQRSLLSAPIVNVPRVPTIADFTGPQFAACEDAFGDAFDRFGLEHMVKIGFDEDLEGIACGDTRKEVIFNLLRWAERQGKLTQLLQGAVDEAPGNPKLMAFVRSLEK
ncbi:MAG: effector-associated domain EAD1-containing protein [Caldilineaceae bacterium]